MNKLSSLIISLSGIAGIGGGIMYTVALCNGVKAETLVNNESFTEHNYYHEVSSSEDDPTRMIKISMVNCDIEVKSSASDKLTLRYNGFTNYSQITIDSVYEIKEEAFHPDNFGSFLNNISFGNLLDTIINHKKCQMTLEIPSWYDRDIKVSTINGDISSTAKNLGSKARFSSTNGDITINSTEDLGDLSINTVNGDIEADLRLTDGNVQQRVITMNTTNGHIIATVSGRYTYTAKNVNGDKDVPSNDNANPSLTFQAKTVNGDIEITQYN